MDKYQKYVFDEIDNFMSTHCYMVGRENEKGAVNYCVLDRDTDSFNITQDEDITKTKYVIIIDLKKCDYIFFNAVFVLKDNRWIEIPCVDKQYRIDIDFDDRADAIKLSFVDKIADDYILKLTYIEADKEQYYTKKEQERKDNLLNTANVQVATGADLVNVYFRPCCDAYDHSEIRLYIPRENGTGSKHSSEKQLESWCFIKRYTVQSDEFFESINGLAYGKYAIILKQFDKENNILIETDYISFFVSRPEVFQGIPVCNC